MTTVSAPVTAGVKAGTPLRLYRQMIAIRLFEERLNDLYTRALMPGLAHLYIGEEGVAVGLCEALRADDYITSTHRGHGHCLAKGAAPHLMFAELLGKKAGYCKGKGGSMHIADPDTGNLGANAIVGGGAALATAPASCCSTPTGFAVTMSATSRANTTGRSSKSSAGCRSAIRSRCSRHRWSQKVWPIRRCWIASRAKWPPRWMPPRSSRRTLRILIHEKLKRMSLPDT